MRALTFAILIALATPLAAQSLDCYSSERFGTRLIKVGDSERRVVEQEPDREVRLENRFGATRGWRYDFYKNNRTVQIYVRSGVVIRICRVPD